MEFVFLLLIWTYVTKPDSSDERKQRRPHKKKRKGKKRREKNQTSCRQQTTMLNSLREKDSERLNHCHTISPFVFLQAEVVLSKEDRFTYTFSSSDVHWARDVGQTLIHANLQIYHPATQQKHLNHTCWKKHIHCIPLMDTCELVMWLLLKPLRSAFSC